MVSTKNGPFFGRNLQELYNANGRSVPAILAESLALLQQGIDNPDLFRQEGNKRKVHFLQKAWDQGKQPLRLAKIHDFCAVSDCVLNWLNSLPSPVIPCKLFHAFIHVHQRNCCHSEWVHQLRVLFDKLEPHESEVTLLLLEFLHTYSQAQQGKNFRSPSLGQIFGPALLKAHDQALPMPFPEEVQAAASLVDCMISNHDILFKPPQSPCASPIKKPPARAKNSPPQKDLQICFSFKDQQRAEEKRNLFAARMVRLEDAPVKHLKVNINKSASIQDENASPLNGNADTKSSLLKLLYDSPACSPAPQPVDAQTGLIDQPSEETELDMVVGSLLSGSLSGVLFEPNDHKFLQRTSSVMSTSSPCMSCQQSEISTGMSSDEEMGHFCVEK